MSKLYRNVRPNLEFPGFKYTGIDGQAEESPKERLKNNVETQRQRIETKLLEKGIAWKFPRFFYSVPTESTPVSLTGARSRRKRF